MPKLVLQPLAENAITYCLEPFIEPCHIHIKAYKKGGFVYLTVTDNGPGMDEDFWKKREESLSGQEAEESDCKISMSAFS